MSLVITLLPFCKDINKYNVMYTEPPPIQSKAIGILTVSSLFLLIALVHLLSIFLCGMFF